MSATASRLPPPPPCRRSGVWGARARAGALALACALAGVAAPPAHAKLDAQRFKEITQRIEQGLVQGLDGQVATALRELAADNDDRSVRYVVVALEKRWESVDIYDAARDFVAKQTDAKALKALRKEADKAKPWQARVLLVDAIGEARGAAEVEFLGETAKDKESKVAVAAVRQLARLKTHAATEALIGVMEWLDDKKKDDDVVWSDCRNALSRILGASLDAGVDYRNFYDSRKAQFVEGQGIPGAREALREGAEGGGTVTLFGEPIRCKNVVIILDRSGSMVLKDPYPPGHKPKVGTTSREDGDRDDEHAWAKDPERERMFRAKAELKKVLEDLARVGAKVNVAVYGSDVTFWREQGLHKLAGPALGEVHKFVDELTAEGVTVTDSALIFAFERVPEADCFYLISDGFATHDGENKVPTPQILDQVAEANRLRKIQINTFGFEAKSGNPKDGADRELMEGLAELTGGTYHEIP